MLLHVFTALLPSPDPDEEDYYTRLGLDRRRRVTAEEIRRAYRSQSLQWHPDKIAQRRGGGGGGDEHAGVTAAEAATRFQGIQEAYQVLSDPEKRKEYHFWNCSIVRYQFVHSNNANPYDLFQNLATARIRDKARLVLVVGVLLTLLILPFILIAAKVNQDLKGSGSLNDASYAALLTPIWMAFAGYFLMVAAVLFVTRNVNLGQIVSLMEMASWLAGLVLLVQRWDGNRVVSNWHAASIPCYFALAFRMLGRIVWVGVIQGEMGKMISVEHLQEVEAEILSGASIEDLTEEELSALHSRYNVVNPDPMQVAAALEILKAQEIDLRAEGQEEELEAVRVQCSPEYQTAAEQVGDARGEAINMLIFGIPLIPLTAAKIQGNITASWWVVILPIWVYWTYRMAQACVLCFGFGGGEDVVVVDAAGEEEGINADGTPHVHNHNNNNNTPNEQEKRAAPGFVEENQQTIVQEDVPEKNPDRVMEPVKEEEEEEDEADERLSPNPFPTPYIKPEEIFAPDEDTLSEAPSDEGAWREAQPRDPPGVSQDDQELQRQEMERRRALFQATQKAKVAATTRKAPPQPASVPAATTAPAPAAGDIDRSVSPNVADSASNDNEQERHGEGPALDEDMFRQWQRMQEEADHSAAEAQAKAQWLCCSTCFQMIVVCLIVGKLEQDYPRPVDGSVGYSTFWILFPVFLLAGIVLCCCSILICYMGDPNMAFEPSNHDDDDAGTDENGEQESGRMPEVLITQVPPPTTTTAVPLPAKPDIEAPPPAVAPPAEDMDELD